MNSLPLGPDRNCRRCNERPGDPSNRFGYARLCDRCWWELHREEIGHLRVSDEMLDAADRFLENH